VKGEKKTTENLIERLKEELANTKKRVAELEASGAEQRGAVEALKQSEKNYRDLVSNAVVGVYQSNLKGDILYVNEALAEMFEFDSPQEMMSGSVLERYRNPGQRADLLRTLKKMGRTSGFEIEAVTKTGSTKDVLVSANLTGETLSGIIVDITGHKAHELEIKKLSTAIEHSVNMISITDADGVIEYVNPVFESATGYPKGSIIGRTSQSFLPEGESTEACEELLRTVLSGKPWKGTLKNKKKDGQDYWAETEIIPIKNEKGDIINFLFVQDDITEKIQSKERIQYLATFDGITNLVNRKRYTGALLIIDIDDFKTINDTSGHIAGDRLLQSAARHIKNTIKYLDELNKERKEKGSIIARLGSDEFAVFMPKRTEKAAAEAAEEIRKTMEAFHFQEIPSQITVSIGVSLYPIHGDTTNELLKKADAATFRAKELGRNKCHLFRPEDRDLEVMNLKLRVKGLILSALKQGKFTPWFQPILGLKSNKVNHFEALVRMQASDGNVLLPGTFLDVAKRYGLIGSIDRVMIEKTMMCQAETKKRVGNVPLSFSMNVSGRDLGDEDFFKFIKSRIKQTGADADKLIFEITETEAVENLDDALMFIEELKDMGCHFALDDFGVGLSSFTHLKQMKVDYIKIDGSFIKRLQHNLDDQLFVKAMIDVARGMGIKTIAEFVENVEVMNILKQYGVDFVQGYLIGRPAPEF
jgi:diguanylate cyclase (GGDEF)-like protein/PAS domain S-box-containing protein